MLTEPNGLLSQAKEAKTSTNKAGAKESLQVEVLGSYETNGKINIDRLYENLKNVPNLKYNKDILSDSNKITSLPADVEINGDVYEIKEDGSVISVVNTIKPGEIVKPEQGNTLYTKNGTAIIPVGFAIVPELDDISEGLVISDKENDTTDEGNQFVWIPVTNSNSYVRNPAYANGLNLKDDTDYLPEGITSESENVTKAKGFYISRYEAGDGSATISKTERTEDSGTTGELVSKKNAYVYNYIKQTEAKEKAKKFTEDGNANVKSGLCTGIQWDMAMAFVNGKKDGKGNDYIVTQSSSNRHTGSLATSGQNLADKVCNIYDLEGNCDEYVAEKNTSSTSGPYVTRSSTYIDKVWSASFRSHKQWECLQLPFVPFRALYNVRLYIFV